MEKHKGRKSRPVRAGELAIPPHAVDRCDDPTGFNCVVLLVCGMAA